MHDLESRLRSIATDALDCSAADVPVEDDLAAVLARATDRPTPAAARDSRWPIDRLAVAAAIVLLVAGAVAVLANRDGGDETVAPPATVSPRTDPAGGLSSPPETANATTTIPIAYATLASAEPDAVIPGSVVTITPAGAIFRRCPGSAKVLDGSGREVGWTEAGNSALIPAPLTERDLGTCERYPNPSADSNSIVVPADLDPGVYRFCIAEGIVPDEVVPEGCALVTVVDPELQVTQTPTTTVTPPTTELAPGSDVGVPFDFFARRYDDAEPYFSIELIDSGGSATHELTADVIAAMLRREIPIGDGVTVRLRAEEQPYGRCDNRSLEATDAAGVDQPDPVRLIGDVRSIAATADGIVIVGRDVCPAGARWGDADTRFELQRIDLADGTVELLVRRDPGEAQVFYADDSVVYASQELVVQSVTNDGRYVVVEELYSTEQARYHVFDAVVGGDPVDLGSSCAQPGDLVGPPQFVAEGLVVVARECSPSEREIGTLAVELVSLDTLQPLWSAEIQSVSIDSYSRTVSLSARLVDGQVWALVSSSAGVEQPVTLAAVHDGVETPIPTSGYVDYAFTADELIAPWDPVPA